MKRFLLRLTFILSVHLASAYEYKLQFTPPGYAACGGLHFQWRYG